MDRGKTGRPGTGAADADWVEILRSRSPEELRTLFVIRPELLMADPDHLGDVAAALVDPASLAGYHREADRAARQVMEVLCVLPPPVRVIDLASALSCSPADLDSVLDRLRLVCAVSTAGAEIVPNPGLYAALPFPCGLGPLAGRLLGELSHAELSRMAQRHGLSPQGAKAELIGRLVGVLGDAAHLAHLQGSAPKGTDRLLDRARWWPDLRLGAPASTMAGISNSPVGWCLQLGLLFAAGFIGAVMPREAALALRGDRLVAGFSPFLPDVPERAVDQAAVDARAAETGLAVAQDVMAVCEEWGAAPAKLLRSGGLGVREVRRVAKLIGRPEAEAARVVELAWAAGLVDEQDEMAMPTPGYDEWRTGDRPARWTALAVAWLGWTSHLGFVGTKGGDGKPVPPLLDDTPDPLPPSQRLTVLWLLSPPGRVAEPAALYQAASWVRPTEWAGPPERGKQVIEWLTSDAALVGMTSGGALSTAGRALLSGEPAEAERALAPYCPRVVHDVILQADLTATVAGEPAPELRAELDLLADVESSGAATVWRFSEASLRRGLDAGRQPEQITGFLSDHSAVAMPQPLSYLIEDLGRRFGHLRVGPAGCYVRCDDPALIADIQRSKKTARLGLRLLAPTVAVSTRTPGEVTEILRDGGYLAAPETEGGELLVTRPPVHRARLDDDDDDFDDDDFDLDGLDLDELLSDPELRAEMARLPGGLAAALVGVAAGNLFSSEEEMDALVDRIRRAPIPGDGAPRAPAEEGKVVPIRPPLTGPTLFDDDARPTHIARNAQEVAGLLEQAHDGGWLVRMGYVNAQGHESEFFAEVLRISRGRVWVGYVGDRKGGAELPLPRVQWARVLTEAEEDLIE